MNGLVLTFILKQVHKNSDVFLSDIFYCTERKCRFSQDNVKMYQRRLTNVFFIH